MGPEAPTAIQRQVADALGIDISRDSSAVAAARIHTRVGPAIRPTFTEYPATARQIAFAGSLGLDVSSDSSLVASARISEELFVRNKLALEKLQLKPGDKVRVPGMFHYSPELAGFIESFVVSSVQPNCRIMFKGGNGRGAWPTQVERITEEKVIEQYTPPTRASV